MRNGFPGGLIAAALGTVLVAAAGGIPASAQVARPQSAFATGGDTSSDLLIRVQRERGSGGGGSLGGGGNVGRSSDGGGGGVRSGGTILRPDRGDRIAPARAGNERSVNLSRDRRGDNQQVTRVVRDRDGKRRRVVVHRYYSYPYWSFGLGYAAVAYPGYCMSQFEAYDPVSGLYLGYDGLWYSCP